MIVVVPKGTLTASQKAQITKKGLIVIECDDPEKIRVINVETSIDTNDFFMSALNALTVSHPVDKQEIFVNNLYKRLIAKETIEEPKTSLLTQTELTIDSLIK